jgi:predicted nucleic acid-binding protein
MRSFGRTTLRKSTVLKVFLDTNIIFEHALKRKQWKDCLELFKMAEDGKIGCLASSASFFTLAYFVQKENAPKDILLHYLSFIQTVPTEHSNLENALRSGFKDVEDGFQYFTALGNADYFITLNIKDFGKHAVSSLPCMTPKSFLAEIQV